MPNDIESIREIIARHKGARVTYRATNGRRKAEARSGVIQDTYPSLFTLFIESRRSTVSFSYSDLLTKEVELQLEPSGENLF